VSRYPHEFSGGQKQRLSLARALALDPELLVADEPVSALDERVQARVLSLLADVQRERDLAVLFISHDIRVVSRFCDRIAVMYLGEIVESGSTEAVLSEPQHPYTQALVDAAPSLDPTDRGSLEVLSGEVPDPASPPTGCRFHTRCLAVIPPDTYDFDPSAFRSVMDLRLALEAGDVDANAVRERIVARGNAETVDDVTDAHTRAVIRERYGVPPTLADPDAEDELSTALEALVAGEHEAATRHLASAFETVCERDKPKQYDTGSGWAACHLHDSV